jgi:hypothetical protein
MLTSQLPLASQIDPAMGLELDQNANEDHVSTACIFGNAVIAGTTALVIAER